MCVFVQCETQSPAGLSELEMLAELCVCAVKGFGLSEPLNT